MSPIPLRELRARAARKGPRPGTLADRLLAVLRKDEAQAWRAVELARKCKADVHTVGTTLRRLRARGLVDQLDEHWFAIDDAEVAKFQAMLITTRLADERLGPERLEDWPAVDLPPRRSRRLGKRE